MLKNTRAFQGKYESKLRALPCELYMRLHTKKMQGTICVFGVYFAKPFKVNGKNDTLRDKKWQALLFFYTARILNNDALKHLSYAQWRVFPVKTIGHLLEAFMMHILAQNTLQKKVVWT